MNLKHVLASLFAIAIAAVGTWAWFDTMEQVWEARYHESDAARKNRMLAATLLLRQNGHPVTVAGSLGELTLPTLPDGSLLLGDAAGVMSPDTARQLLAWVRRGNTLIAQPRWMSSTESDEDEEDETPAKPDAAPAHAEAGGQPAVAPVAPAAPVVQEETDPIGTRVGARLDIEPSPAQKCHAPAHKADLKACLAHAKDEKTARRRIQVPGNGYWLELDAGRTKLTSLPTAPAPLWSDEHADTVRVHAEGKGHIVMLAGVFFDNADLRVADHGELLLALAALNHLHTQVTIVTDMDAMPWYKALWWHYKLVLISLACCAALLLWAAMRRFGPLLPQPALERRSLMEHIDASGAWLWQAEGGRQLLLAAAREETLTMVRRRAPALLRLSEHELAAALAELAGLDRNDVEQALHQDAARQVTQFTRQIRTLQELRNHYER